MRGGGFFMRLINIWNTATVLQKCGGVVALLFILAVLIAGVAWLRYRKRKKRAREKYRREIEYALPDRENTFVRDRLQTALRVPPKEEYRVETDFCFTHAQTLAVRIGESARATQIEKLELEETLRMIESYENKTRFSASDVRRINDAFNRILKLSAKYL